jgi:hypothetical protein
VTVPPDTSPAFAPRGSSTDQLLTGALVVAPVLYLAVDTIYAIEGWDDPTAGVIHVFGAIAYGLVILRVATWLPGRATLTAALLVAAIAGSIGNAVYGFEAIHLSLGDVALVDRSGAAALIKPIGLLFPLALALAAVGLHRLQHRSAAVLVLLAAVGWPIAHIANIGPLAVAVNVLLVIAFGSVAWTTRSAPRRTLDPTPA